VGLAAVGGSAFFLDGWYDRAIRVLLMLETTAAAGGLGAETVAAASSSASGGPAMRVDLAAGAGGESACF
jgi:hypothetical protein